MMFDLVKEHLASVVFPPHCMQCQAALSMRAPQQWCDECLRGLKGQSCAACLSCGAHLPQTSPFADGCAVCLKTRINFDAAISIGNYRGALQKVIREMKRASSESIAHQLGRVLAQCMGERAVGIEADLIVPMPIHWWKKLKRGFNASSIIADGISAALKIPQRKSVLRYSRLTQKQGTLSTQARIKNVQGAIRVKNPKSLVGRHIVLVDDVTTSCATANEATKALRKAGAKEVTLAVAARGVRAS